MLSQIAFRGQLKFPAKHSLISVQLESIEKLRMLQQ